MITVFLFISIILNGNIAISYITKRIAAYFAFVRDNNDFVMSHLLVFINILLMLQTVLNFDDITMSIVDNGNIFVVSFQYKS